MGKYPKYPEIPERKKDTRKYPIVFLTLLPDPNPTRYPVFCPLPDPTRYWKTLPAGHWVRDSLFIFAIDDTMEVEVILLSLLQPQKRFLRALVKSSQLPHCWRPWAWRRIRNYGSATFYCSLDIRTSIPSSDRMSPTMFWSFDLTTFILFSDRISKLLLMFSWHQNYYPALKKDAIKKSLLLFSWQQNFYPSFRKDAIKTFSMFSWRHYFHPPSPALRLDVARVLENTCI